MTTSTLEELLRAVAARGLSISLTGVTANDHDGFSACVYRYPLPDGDASHLVNRRDDDPVAALRAALVEHLRWQADQQRRYTQMPKLGARKPADDFDAEDLLG